MRSLHIQLNIEYDREIVKKFHHWERYEKKMADFANHRRFTLRCLAEDLVPVSICLKQNIKTPKGLQIIKKAERALLNERVRSIINTLNMLKPLRDTCMNELERVINEDWMTRCKDSIEVRRENHHLKTLKRQKDKFNRLLHKKHVREGECTKLQGIHIDHYSNPTRKKQHLPHTRR